MEERTIFWVLRSKRVEIRDDRTRTTFLPLWLLAITFVRFGRLRQAAESWAQV